MFNFRFVLISQTAALLLMSSWASAQGTASSPSTVHDNDPSSNTFWVGGPNDLINGPLPIPIDLDASGGPWRKEFFSSSTAGYGGDGFFRETILNAGTEPWTDWHEINANLGSHGAAWGTSSVTDLRVNGISISFTASMSGSTLNIDNFSQPVLPGQVLEIDKEFAATTAQFVGPNTLLYTLLEFPTTNVLVPEPTSAVLMATALFGTLVLRRRQR